MNDDGKNIDSESINDSMVRVSLLVAVREGAALNGFGRVSLLSRRITSEGMFRISSYIQCFAYTGS